LHHIMMCTKNVIFSMQNDWQLVAFKATGSSVNVNDNNSPATWSLQRTKQWTQNEISDEQLETVAQRTVWWQGKTLAGKMANFGELASWLLLQFVVSSKLVLHCWVRCMLTFFPHMLLSVGPSFLCHTSMICFHTQKGGGGDFYILFLLLTDASLRLSYQIVGILGL